ncbi:MAG: sugar phosphate isomerase/epimerase [Oscillospiraceae bacterium]|nr:sugar phosphate isomerase/epimerase [Oscillospiraceae bacterium]
MYRSVSFGAINANPGEGLEAAVEMAKKYGFTGIESHPGQIRSYGEERAKELLASNGMVISGFGLPVHPIRSSEKEWQKGIEEMPSQAKTMKSVDTNRCCIWLENASDTLGYDENFEFHVERLSPFAKILGDFDIRLGLEFIGTKSMRDSKKHEFIYTAEKMLELARACGPNCGLLFDAWHWYMSGGDREVFSQIGDQKYIVNVHINDAPGKNRETMPDSPRALPGETGIIDIKFFMDGLKRLGYDGPVMAEPFSPVLSAMSNADEIMATVRSSFDKIW